jgi:hypothetical protein
MSVTVPVVVNHGVLCWISGCELCCAMLVHHGELYWASGCESWCAMLSQWLWIMCAMLNRTVVNHVVLYWADYVWAMVCYAEPLVINDMSQWFSIMVCYAEPVVVNHGELWCASGCELWYVMMCQWVWIMMYNAEPVVVNHGELWWASNY